LLVQLSNQHLASISALALYRCHDSLKICPGDRNLLTRSRAQNMRRVSMARNSESQAFSSSVQVRDPLLAYGVGVILHHVTKVLEMLLLEAGLGIHVYHVKVSLANLYSGNIV
jgi:hypothetical protein